LKLFCDPVVGITWNEENLIEELRKDGFEVHLVPENKRNPAYNDVRKKLDIWFDRFCVKSDSRKIQQAYLDQFISFKQKFIRNIRQWYNIAKLYIPLYRQRLFKKEEFLLRTATNFNELTSFINALNIDAVFSVTPYHRQEDILLRACKYKGKKMLTSILSFDNITKRGWMPVEYDLYMIWNEHNKRQLNRIYPFTNNKPVYVIGAAQFDFYFKEEYLLPVDEWKKITGIPAMCSRKIILYAGGPEPLFPNEPLYLKDINEAINKGLIKDNPLVLFRCHPIDKIDRWKEITGSSKNIVFDDSWTGKENLWYANITVKDIKKLCSTLAYTDVHINLCSTMTVDGSAFNKPQIGPAYVTHDIKGSNLLEKMYSQEHFVPVINTNGLHLARSAKEMIQLINQALQTPQDNNNINEAILKNIITYSDGRTTERLASVIKDFLC